MSLWSGRFSKETDAAVNDFNSSLPIDRVLFRQDIAGSLAHAEMLGACGVIAPEDAAAIAEGLSGILADLESGALTFDPAAEDIHMFVETVLTERVGQAGKRLHTARSRNDQVALDLRLYLRGQIDLLTEAVLEAEDTLLELAGAHLHTVMPGYTHLQIAQPVTFAHHLLAYAQMLRRDLGRLSDCRRRMNLSPLGAGALATTTYAIDREMTARRLGFSGVAPNSMDAVSDRDFCLELASALSILMTHLSRLSEELILWCSTEFGFIELDDAYATGSSIMPQKKNPDIPELIRGKAGRVNGNLVALLTLLKGLPLCYNKDLQEDKPAIFDSVETALSCLEILPPMLRTMTVKTDRMRQAAQKGFINATDCADYLVGKGLPFRDAYRVTGELVRLCAAQNRALEDLSPDELQAFCPAFDEGVYTALNLDACVARRSVLGGPAPEAVAKQMADLRAALEGIR